MSLEERILSLNESILKLTEVIEERFQNDNNSQALVETESPEPVEEEEPKPAPKKRGRPRKNPPNLVTVRTKFKDLIELKNKQAAVKILNKFNCEKVPELDPSDYAAVLAAIEEAANEPDVEEEDDDLM